MTPARPQGPTSIQWYMGQCQKPEKSADFRKRCSRRPGLASMENAIVLPVRESTESQISSLQLRGWGPFCSVLDSLSTKWFWERFSSLQNGMATNLDPTKWCSLPTILDFLSTTILIGSSQHSCSLKTPEPFCRASTLSGTQLQGQFFHSHFVGFLPCHPFFFNFTKKIIKIVSQFLHVAKPYIFGQQYADILETNGNQRAVKKNQCNATEKGNCKIVRAKCPKAPLEK